MLNALGVPIKSVTPVDDDVDVESRSVAVVRDDAAIRRHTYSYQFVRVLLALHSDVRQPTHHTFAHLIQSSIFPLPIFQMSTDHCRKKSTGPPKTVLVVGATGRQGRAVISALFLRSDFRILALTRRPSAAASRALLNRRWTTEPIHALLELVQGDLDQPQSIRKIFEAEGKGGIAAVFVALAFPGLGARADKEESQGIVSFTNEWLVLLLWTLNSYWQILPSNLAYHTLYSQALREVVRASITLSHWTVRRKLGLSDISRN